MKNLKVSLSLLLLPLALAAAETESWQFYQQQFQESQHHPAKAKEALIEIIKLGDKNAISFFQELFALPQETRGGLYARYPDDDFKRSNSYRGIAQAGLAALGDEERWKELIAESFHPHDLVRLNAFEKIRLIPGERAIEALSNFLGDSDEGGDRMQPIEWDAVLELTRRLEDPPFSVNSASDLHPGYYSDGGREKWLRWRYENYGPIPGREELFADLIAEKEIRPDAVEATPESAAAEGSNGDTAAREATEPDRGAHSRWLWLWILGGVVAAAAIVLVLRRTRAGS